MVGHQFMNKIKVSNIMKSWIVGGMALVLLMVWPTVIFAHASLMNSVPEQDSQLQESPKQISLTFNERLEDSLYYIKVIDGSGKSVTDQKARLTDTHNGLVLDLPKLSEGIYVTTYHVISTDGHPVSGSYLMTIGKPSSNDLTVLAPEDTQEFVLSKDMNMRQILQSLSRVVYYISLLLLIGTVVWTAILSQHGQEEVAKRLRMWVVGLLRVFIVAIIWLIYFHYRDLLGEGGLQELLGLFIHTSIGLSWLSSIILAILGFAILHRKRWIDFAWVALMIAAKSLNGHAFSHQPRTLTLLLDWVHLTAAAVWTGGLLIIIILWRQRTFMESFLQRFSRVTLLTMLVMLISGALTTILFLPKITYVLYSQWGILLLIKIALVLLVIIVGAIVRRMLVKKGFRGLGLSLKVDFTLMILILSIVGLLTYSAPVPANEPLYWHEMGEKAHLTLAISPNVPGVNTFRADLWMPEKEGKPKKIELQLTDVNNKSVAPISIPLEVYVDPNLKAGEDLYEGFKLYTYKSTGPFLPYAGKWSLQMRITSSNDEDIVYTHDMRVY